MLFVIKNLFFQKNTSVLTSTTSYNFNKSHLQYLLPITNLYNIEGQSFSDQTNRIKTTTSSKIFFLKTKDLLKPIVCLDISWSAGMIANLLFNTKNIYKKKNLTAQNVRRDWSLWKYIIILWFNQSQYFLISLSPFSIRIRRFLKILKTPSLFFSILYCWESYKTPKRSIKRWLKKKYTTQSWR